MTLLIWVEVVHVAVTLTLFGALVFLARVVGRLAHAEVVRMRAAAAARVQRVIDSLAPGGTAARNFMVGTLPSCVRDGTTTEEQAMAEIARYVDTREEQTR